MRPRLLSRLLPAVMLAFACLGGPAAEAADPVIFWNLDKLLSLQSEEIELTDDQGKAWATLPYHRLALLNEVRTRIESASGTKADCYVVTGEKPNAFATNVTTGRNLFAINLAMLSELGSDADALAVLLGHELAHLERNHIRQKLEKAKDVQATHQVVGTILGSVIPGGGLLSALVADAVLKGYSRDQEREADTFGLDFAVKAGFNPYGGVRLFTMMHEKRGDKWATFLSTHPSSADRIEAIRANIAVRTKDGPPISETQVTTPAVSDERQPNARAVAVGDYRAVVFDPEERVPTLHQKVTCRLPDGSEVRTTRVDCIQQDGSLKK
jgi:Peptidase family M48